MKGTAKEYEEVSKAWSYEGGIYRVWDNVYGFLRAWSPLMNSGRNYTNASRAFEAHLSRRRADVRE